jgi:hypothetical protein
LFEIKTHQRVPKIEINLRPLNLAKKFIHDMRKRICWGINF